jgi:hypothetical protein
MAKKAKRLSRKERRALEPKPAGPARHIHCVACGRHLDAHEFSASPVTARYISCMHATKYAVCSGCVTVGQRLLDEHDRSGQPVHMAQAWH